MFVSQITRKSVQKPPGYGARFWKRNDGLAWFCFRDKPDDGNGGKRGNPVLVQPVSSRSWGHHSLRVTRVLWSPQFIALRSVNIGWLNNRLVSVRVLGDTIHFALLAFSGLPNSSRNKCIPGRRFLCRWHQGQVAFLLVWGRVRASQGKVSPKGHPTSVST